MSRHRIRKIVLGIIFIAIIAGVFLRLKVEPANYRESLQNEVKEAIKIAKEAVIGNEEGQYSKFRLLQFEEQIAYAKEVCENLDLEYEELKAHYETFKKEQKAFKNNKNSDVISKAEIEKLILNQDKITKEVDFLENRSVLWEIDGSKVKDISPINCGVTSETLTDDTLQQFLERLNVEGTAITFLHNGSFPSTINIVIDYVSSLNDVQVYPFNWETNEFDTMIRGEVKDNKLFFPIQNGGTYLIIEKEINDDNTISDKINDTLKDIENLKDNGASEIETSASDMTSESSQATSNSYEAEEPSKDSNSVNNGNETQISGPTSYNDKNEQVQTEGGDTQANLGTSAPSKAPSSPPVVETAPPVPEPVKQYCTIEIRCDTIVDTSKLTNQAVAPFVPADGTILSETKVEIKEGDSAFDILRRITRNKGIQMEFRDDPMYSGAKVEGINHIYEKDAGAGSGWMYKVNGWFPNYGSSQYKVKDGDKIVYCYTCDIGKDVGDQYYD